MKLYIAGPMTGYPGNNFSSFDYWKEKLIPFCREGVISPADISRDNPGLTYEQYMEMDIRAILDCTGIFVFGQWQRSRGASFEVHLARMILKKPVLEWNTSRGRFEDSLIPIQGSTTIIADRRSL